MNFKKLGLWVTIASFTLLLPAALFADTNCDDGSSALNSAVPRGITPEEIIQKFAAKEAIFREARNNYTYTQDITVQTLEGNTVDGEFRRVEDITYDDKGTRIEYVTFAPQPSLTRILLTKEDEDDFRNRLPFVLTTQELPQYSVLYAGQQHVDEIDTFVFDLAPKQMEKGKRYFQGRIWVDNHDFQIVKTCGKNVPDYRKSGKHTKAEDENLSPKFVTYREQIDGQYWFPTYTRADDVLHFTGNDVHVREIIKYTRYKRFGSKTKITYEGAAQPDKNAPPPKKP
jgi:hypothetical protein